MSKALAVCLLNVSEGRNKCIIEKIARAACSSTRHGGSHGNPSPNTTYGREHQGTFKCSSTVLNIFSDYDYNRSVLTIAAPCDRLAHSVANACKVAYQEIDLGEHCGTHPRLGAVDLVPVYPISPFVSLEQCGQIAQDIGTQIITETPGASVFFFGSADHQQRNLVQRRKEVGWYNGKHGTSYLEGVAFDMGVPPTPRYGLTGVGASWYVMNCNVTIETGDVRVGRRIADMIRASSDGGLPGVQAMAFKHEGKVEIACNVESYIKEDHSPNDETKSPKLQYTTAAEIRERIQILAAKYGISVCDTTIVGFTPDEVYDMAIKALCEGNEMAWRTTQLHRM